MSANYLTDGHDTASTTLLLAHGAGLPMDSPFMSEITAMLLKEAHPQSLRIVRFEFPYMAKRRDDGKKRPPDQPKVLLQCWADIVDDVSQGADSAQRLYVGGKSMGGRYGAQIAKEVPVAGCVVFGYPFHAPGKPDKPRLEPLNGVDSSVLICQGERDPFGKPLEVQAYALDDRVTVEWIPDGDHDLKPRKKSGFDQRQNIAIAARLAVAFMGLSD